MANIIGTYISDIKPCHWRRLGFLMVHIIFFERSYRWYFLQRSVPTIFIDSSDSDAHVGPQPPLAPHRRSPSKNIGLHSGPHSNIFRSRKKESGGPAVKVGTSTHSQDTRLGYIGPYLAMIAFLLDNKGDEVSGGDIVLAKSKLMISLFFLTLCRTTHTTERLTALWLIRFSRRV